MAVSDIATSQRFDRTNHIFSGEGLIDDVPYVWQEINGFCSWAAASIMFQSAGIPADMYTLFAASTAGFSFVSARYNDTLIPLPGVYYRQDINTLIAAQVFGLNLTFYFDSNTPSAELNRAAMESDGISVSLIDGDDGAMNLMRTTINRGHPLMISVDPIWLPADDYDYIRDLGAYGGGHGVVIVGYDDDLLQATIMDPGVGAFGDNYGYPEDGRGNYTTISYWDLRQAWSARDYVSLTIEEGPAPVDPQSYIGPIIRDRLLGDTTSYRAIGEAAIIGKYGEASFRDLSNFFTPDGIMSLLSAYDGSDNEQYLKTLILINVGVGLEASFTLQHLSYRKALSSLVDILPMSEIGVDFYNIAGAAMNHFPFISSNTSLIYSGTNLSVYTGLISSTFIDIATEYNSTGDINSALTEFDDELTEISMHVVEIADVWLAAGNSLAVIWPNDFLATYGFILIPATIGVAAVILTIIYWIKRSPSQ
jgi:hypothetical protein